MLKWSQVVMLDELTIVVVLWLFSRTQKFSLTLVIHSVYRNVLRYDTIFEFILK